MARDELPMLLLGPLRPSSKPNEDSPAKEILDLREDAFLDDLADLFVRSPARVLAAILRPATAAKI